MADEDTGGKGAEDTGADQFDPKTLSPEAQEYIRKSVQSESDSKAEAKTAAEVSKLRAEQARSARSAVESAEEKELTSLAESGQHEALGQRIAAKLASRSIETRAIVRTSDEIEGQMREAFNEVLGPSRVEEIHQETKKAGGAHAEFALGLARAADGKARAEEIQTEVKAALAEAGVKVRDETAGPDKGTAGGQGQKPSTEAEIEQAYIDGRLTGGRKAYEAMLEARDKGR